MNQKDEQFMQIFTAALQGILAGFPIDKINLAASSPASQSAREVLVKAAIMIAAKASSQLEDKEVQDNKAE